MTQEQLKEEIDKTLREMAQHYLEIVRPGEYEVSENFHGEGIDAASIAILTAFNNHVDRSKPEKKSIDDKDITSWEQGHQNAGFNVGVDEFTANLKRERK